MNQNPYRAPAERPSVTESGQFPVLDIMKGEFLKRVAQSYGLDLVEDETDERLRERIVNVLNPPVGRTSSYP